MMKPPPCRIGVTGHRILAEMDKINAGIDAALQRIERAFAERPLIIVSPLAEGADRLVAERVLARRHAQLIVPLPLPKADYLNDFEDAISKREFNELLKRAERVIELPPSPSRRVAYDAVGRYVLDQCDVLIAVWDGQLDNGTGRVVTDARRRGLPIAWVHAGNRKPGTTEPTSLGHQQGRVTFESF